MSAASCVCMVRVPSIPLCWSSTISSAIVSTATDPVVQSPAKDAVIAGAVTSRGVSTMSCGVRMSATLITAISASGITTSA